MAKSQDDVVFLYGACGAGAALAVDKCAELGFSFKPRAHLVVGALADAWLRLSDDGHRAAPERPLAAAPVPRVGGGITSKAYGIKVPPTRGRRPGGIGVGGAG